MNQFLSIETILKQALCLTCSCFRRILHWSILYIGLYLGSIHASHSLTPEALTINDFNFPLIIGIFITQLAVMTIIYSLLMQQQCQIIEPIGITVKYCFKRFLRVLAIVLIGFAVTICAFGFLSVFFAGLWKGFEFFKIEIELLNLFCYMSPIIIVFIYSFTRYVMRLNLTVIVAATQNLSIKKCFIKTKTLINGHWGNIFVLFSVLFFMPIAAIILISSYGTLFVLKITYYLNIIPLLYGIPIFVVYIKHLEDAASL